MPSSSPSSSHPPVPHSSLYPHFCQQKQQERTRAEGHSGGSQVRQGQGQQTPPDDQRQQEQQTPTPSQIGQMSAMSPDRFNKHTRVFKCENHHVSVSYWRRQACWLLYSFCTAAARSSNHICLKTSWGCSHGHGSEQLQAASSSSPLMYIYMYT